MRCPLAKASGNLKNSDSVVCASPPGRLSVSAVTPHSTLRIQKGSDFRLFVIILYLASPEDI